MLRSETADDPVRAAAALAGLRAYQRAPRPDRPAPAPVIAAAGRARLLDFSTGGDGRTVVVVPSLINGWHVLDLLPELSLLRWLAEQGLRPLLVDWGMPGPDDAAMTVAGHIEDLLLPLLRNMPAGYALAGYCLGGTMALAAAAVAPPAALALIASPWRFTAFPDGARAGLAALWDQARPAAEVMSVLPLEVLQAGFWRLDPKRTIDKFAVFGAGAQDAAATRLFVALEDWANGGPPLPLAAGRELLEDLFGRDVTGAGVWRVGGREIDPAALACPVLDIVSSVDRIVPAASAVGIGRRLTLDQGHVGMMVGRRRIETLWQPLAAFLRDPAG